MSTDSGTPPHHPTYNVKLSQTKIAAIIDRIYPGATLIQCEQLPSGKSFNNRIYFLVVEAPDTQQSLSPPKLVLKLCGQYFSSRKVQNEVGTFQLLEHFCPTVPISKIIAWSEDGSSISIFDDGQRKILTDMAGSNEAEDHVSKMAWVLQSWLPGRELTFDDLDGPHGSSILRQLATYMATWRTAIPDPALIGNLRFANGNEAGLLTSQSVHHTSGPTGLAVGGLILTHQYDIKPLSSWAEYYEYQLQDQYEHLLNTPALSRLKDSIQEPVADFLLRLPKLPFLANTNTNIRFSHMDFCPRNTLVSEDAAGALSVTGLVDWEFSTFLPSPSEFLNSLINQSTDWPPHHYRTFMNELQKLEHENAANGAVDQKADLPSMDPPSEPCIDAARCRCSYHTLRHLGMLEGIIYSTAPWWIGATSHLGREDELERECAKATEAVLGGIETLRVFWEEEAK